MITSNYTIYAPGKLNSDYFITKNSTGTIDSDTYIITDVSSTITSDAYLYSPTARTSDAYRKVTWTGIPNQIRHYRLNESSGDFIDYGYDKTDIDTYYSLSRAQNGQVDKCIKCNANGDRIEFGGETVLFSSTSNFSIGFWFRTLSTPGFSTTLLKSPVESGRARFNLSLESDDTIIASFTDGTTGPSVTAPIIPLSTDLVSYYKLDTDNATQPDSVGSNDLTVSGATYTASGKINSGYNFVSASTQYMSVADNIVGTGSKTISLWYYATLPANLSQLICNAAVGLGSADVGTQLYIGSDGLIGAIIGNAGGTGHYFNPQSATGVISNSNWYHVVLVQDGSTSAKLYVNGILVATDSTPSGTEVVGDGTMYVGRQPGAGSYYLDGVIDEVGFWSRALLASEVTELYNNGHGRQYPFEGSLGGDLGWNHIGVTYDGSTNTLKLYINRLLVGTSTTVFTAASASTGNWQLGLAGDGFDCWFEDLRIFDRTCIQNDFVYIHHGWEGTAEHADQDSTGGSAVQQKTTQWQSFTCANEGWLTKILITSHVSGPPTNGTLSIYSGTGTGGTLMYSQPCTWTSAGSVGGWPRYSTTLSKDVELSKETVYTFNITQASPGIWFRLDTPLVSGDYTRGREQYNSNYDLLFTTYMKSYGTYGD